MGRNFPSSTDLVHQVISDLQPLADLLPAQDRLIFREFTDLALNRRYLIANVASLTPLEVTLFVVLLEEHKRNQRLYGELRAELSRLKQAIQRSASSTDGSP
jgi:hypothetical protein